MKKHQKNIKEEMYPLITLWKESGLNQSQYCKQEKISYYIFKYWLQKYRKQESTAKQNPPTTFLPVQIPSTAKVSTDPIPKEDIVINYPNGVQVRCPVNIETAQLKALIKL